MNIIEIGGFKFDAQEVERNKDILEFAKKERLDAGQTGFLLRELTILAAQAKEILYPELMARNCFTVVSGMGSGIENVNHEIYDYSGKAKIVADNATDFPLAGTSVSEMTTKVRRLAESIEYSDFELIKAARAGRPLEQRKMNAAVRAIENGIDDIAWNGDANSGLRGFWTDLTDMTNVTIPEAGTGSGAARKDWIRKTAAQIEADIVLMISAIPRLFKKMKYNLLVDPYNEDLLKTKRVGVDTSDTLYDLFTNKFKLNILSVPDFETVSALSNVGGAALSPQDPDIIQLLIPQDRTQKAPMQIGRKTRIDFEAEISGIVKFYPKAVVTADRVGNGSHT